MIEIKRPAIWALAAYGTGIAASTWIGQHTILLLVLALSAIIAAWILSQSGRL